MLFTIGKNDRMNINTTHLKKRQYRIEYYPQSINYSPSFNSRKTSGDEAATARRILENCLNLLDRKKYPQIAASASYLLADIYIPEELDPLNPNLDNSEPMAGNSNPENLDNISKSAKKRKKKKDKKNKNKGENSKNEVINEPNYQETKTPEVSVDDLRNQEEPPEPPVSITFLKYFWKNALVKDLFLFQMTQVF